MEIVKPGFIYTIERLSPTGEVLSVQTVENLMPTDALNYWISAALKGGSQYATWYLGLYANNFTPASTDTMTTLMAGCGEIKSYTGTARQAITLSAVASATTDSIADPNVFEFAAGVTIRGVFISSSPTWDSTSGLLLSARLLTTPETINSGGGALRVPLGFSLVG